MDHGWFSPEWLDMSIAGMATSLDAFPTAPARALSRPNPACDCFFFRNPTHQRLTTPARWPRPPQLLQISIVDASDELPARRTDASVGAAIDCNRDPSHASAFPAVPDSTAGRTIGWRRREAKLREGMGIEGLHAGRAALGGQPADRVELRPPVNRRMTQCVLY
jgi:hypothetical protein